MTFTLLCLLFYLVPQEILVTAPKIVRGGGRLSFKLLFIPQLGAMTILVTAPKYVQEEEGIYIVPAHSQLSPTLQSGAMICYGTRDCKRYPSTSLY